MGRHRDAHTPESWERSFADVRHQFAVPIPREFYEYRGYWQLHALYCVDSVLVG